MAYLFDKKNGYRLLDAAGFVLKDVEGLTLITDRTAAIILQHRRYYDIYFRATAWRHHRSVGNVSFAD